MQNFTADQNSKIDTAIHYLEIYFDQADTIYASLAEELGITVQEARAAVAARYTGTTDEEIVAGIHASEDFTVITNREELAAALGEDEDEEDAPAPAVTVPAIEVRKGDRINLQTIIDFYNDHGYEHETITYGINGTEDVLVAQTIYRPGNSLYWSREQGRTVTIRTQYHGMFLVPEGLEIPSAALASA